MEIANSTTEFNTPQVRLKDSRGTTIEMHKHRGGATGFVWIEIPGQRPVGFPLTNEAMNALRTWLDTPS